ncbi:MAG TPA: acyl-CoA dehydrogenase family protein, partial [Chthoniobacteraceae bacterium]
RMAAEIFAMEAMTFYTASLVDKDKRADIRLEAAMCKLWASERAWEIVDATMQIRGGRGYETAQSLAARGEKPVPVERMLRDCRINTIFEGSSEIMRLFIAREALDPHLKVGAPVLNTQLPGRVRLRAAMKAATFYAGWYPKQWIPFASGEHLNPKLARHIRWAERATHHLARALFHVMTRFGPKLEREQVLLGRFVDIGTELFAIAATCARAQGMGDKSAIGLADYFCRIARLKIEGLFEGLHHNADRSGYKLAQEVLGGSYDWLGQGMLDLPDAVKKECVAGQPASSI